MDIRATVSSCQALCERHIPLLMAVGGDLFDGEPNRKKKRGPMTNDEEREMLRRYTDLDEDTYELAQEFNISINTLRNIASQRGVKRPRHER